MAVCFLSGGIFMIFIKRLRSLFTPKKVIIISKKGITSLSVGIILQYLFLFFIIAGIGFSLSILKEESYYRSIALIEKVKLETKETELSLSSLKNKQLLEKNNKILEKISDIEKSFEEIDLYLSNIGSYDQISNVHKDKNPEVKEKPDEKGLLKINSAISKIYSKTINRRIFIEKIISKIDISQDYLAKYNKKFATIIEKQSLNIKNQGGEFIEIAGNYDTSDLNSLNIEKNNLRDEIIYVSELEKIFQHLPVSKPMYQYYISSNFGIRNDPVKKRKAIHSGLDMAGGVKEKIYSTGSGIVTMSKRYGSYGNMIEIDHGFGFKTRYGHLSKMLVKKGDKISRGQNIGIQGTTGRSTGLHLHYEILHNNKPVNPLKFLYAKENVHKS